MIEYLRDPVLIYRRSFALIRAEADLSGLPEDVAGVALRLVHACGLPEITARLAWSAGAVAAGRAAIAKGAPILCDGEMLVKGILRERLPARNEILCLVSDPRAGVIARERETTRSAAAVELWRERMEGAVAAIGTAPTALFRLLELLEEGAPKPALILGFPVGFVGAAEAKETLIAESFGVPFLTLRGRFGGSALAAAAVNALAVAEGEGEAA